MSDDLINDISKLKIGFPILTPGVTLERVKAAVAYALHYSAQQSGARGASINWYQNGSVEEGFQFVVIAMPLKPRRVPREK